MMWTRAIVPKFRTFGLGRAARCCTIFCMAATPPVAATAQTADELARAGEYVQQAFQARESNDLEAYLTGLESAEELRPGHPDLLYYIAGAQALNGRSADAIAGLVRLARMGLGFRAATDPDFEAISQLDEFQDVVQHLQDNRDPTGTSFTAFTVPGERSFVPEGLAYDAESRSFFLGSVHQRKILRIDQDGSVTEFAEPGFAGLMSAMGMVVDPRERVLWVCTAGIPETAGLSEDNLGRSAIFKFDLETGALLLHYHFSNSEQQRVVGDLVLADDGDVYVSDARGSGIHRIRAGGDFLETFVQPGVFRSPQGLAVSADQRGLFVADYSRGIFYVRRSTREAKLLASPDDAALLGIDGLVRDGDALIAVQNGTMPHRILRLQLSPDETRITEVRTLASNLPEWDEPTLGLMLGDRFYYVANSHWNRFVDGQLGNPESLSEPRVMWLNPG